MIWWIVILVIGLVAAIGACVKLYLDKSAVDERVKRIEDIYENEVRECKDDRRKWETEYYKLLKERDTEINGSITFYDGRIKELDDELNAMYQQQEALSEEKEALEAWIDDHKKMKEVILAAEEKKTKGVKIEWVGAEKEKNERLIGLVEEVIKDYPELREELNLILWKRVWLPAMQKIVKLCDVNESGGGIYRLVVEEDGNSWCYVGQAVNFKNRWYTHAKKICGAAVANGERLYQVVKRLDKVRWEVVEIADGWTKEEMDERERFWIEFYGAELNVK